LNLVARLNGPKLADEYAEARSFDWNGLNSLATADGDMMHINPIIALMQTWLPILTTAVWTQEDAKDRERMIEAALRKEFKCQELKEEDANLRNKKLSDLIDKGIKKELAKQVVVIKRQMRKNSSGGVESQTPKPGKNGQSSKKSSNASAAAKKNQQQQKSNPKKDNKAEQSSGKKRKESKAKSPSSNRPPKQRKRNQGSAGGSNGGGKKNGAARR
jgi:membrane peptidoglycan carboxypeptidase